MRNALRTELDLALQINGHAGVVRGGPVPDSGDARRASAVGLGRFPGGCVGLQFGLLSGLKLGLWLRIQLGLQVGFGPGLGANGGIPVLPCRVVGAFIRVSNFLAGLLLLLLRSLFLGVRFAAEFDRLPPGVFCQSVLGIAMQKLLKNPASLLAIVEIVFINLAYGEQSVATIFATRILPPQELVLGNGLIQNLFVFKVAPHLHQGLRDRNHAGVCLGRRRRPVINVAIGVDDPLIVVTRALRWRTPVERFPHPLRTGKALTSPGFTVMSTRAGMRRHSGEGHQHEQRSPAQTALARCHFQSRRSVTVLIRRCR